MGVSASNCASDLTALAAGQAAARESLIERIAAERGMDRSQAQAFIDGARRHLNVKGQTGNPNLHDHGVAAPVTVRGELYQAVESRELGGGDRETVIVRPLGGGRYATRRVIERVEGGERTRVVSSARGG